MSEKVNLPVADRQRLLASRVCDLPLVVAGSPLGGLVDQLYAELKRAGVAFRPPVYLSDSWGCPNRAPIIGVPFYLADSRLCSVVSSSRDCPIEDELDVKRYLRHEAGHAFEYSYLLYKEQEWRNLFGSFNQPYHEYFPAHPFSPHFVRHIPGWYTQKHPDEDFAETFAVWLTPGSRWRTRYADTSALAKLEYVDQVAKRLGKTRPILVGGTVDRPLTELRMTLGEWCAAGGGSCPSQVKLPSNFRKDLKDLFPDNMGELVSRILKEDCWQLLDEVHAITGLDSDLLYGLIQALMRMSGALKLKAGPNAKIQARMKLAILITTLAMHFQQTGTFVEIKSKLVPKTKS